MDNKWKEFDYDNIPQGSTWDIAIRYDNKIVIINNVYFNGSTPISWYDSKRDYAKKYPNFVITNIKPHKER